MFKPGRVCLCLCTLFSAWLAGGVSGSPWTPSSFPNPAVDLGQCGRLGRVSRVCDPDGVLQVSSANAVDGILNEVVLPTPPYAAAPCSGLAPGRQGFQVCLVHMEFAPFARRLRTSLRQYLFDPSKECYVSTACRPYSCSKGLYAMYRYFQVGVAIMKKMNLQGQRPEEAAASFGQSLFRSWGVGDTECGNGAVLLVATEDRQVWSKCTLSALKPIVDKLGFPLATCQSSSASNV